MNDPISLLDEKIDQLNDFQVTQLIDFLDQKTFQFLTNSQKDFLNELKGNSLSAILIIILGKHSKNHSSDEIEKSSATFQTAKECLKIFVRISDENMELLQSGLNHIPDEARSEVDLIQLIILASILMPEIKIEYEIENANTGKIFKSKKGNKRLKVEVHFKKPSMEEIKKLSQKVLNKLGL